MARLKKGEVARNVAFLVWEDELAREGKTYGDLLKFTESLNVPIAISPWHNQDRYTAQDVKNWVDRHIDPDFYGYISDDLEEVRAKAPKVGDVKKSHCHCLIKNSGPRNRDYYAKLMAPFVELSPTKFEKVEHLDAYICYLVHKNTPSKHRYSELDVVAWGGIDVSALLKTDKSDKLNTFLWVKQQVRESNWRYFHQLDAWADSTRDMDVISCVKGNCSYFNSLFRSRREERQDRAAAQESKAKQVES